MNCATTNAANLKKIVKVFLDFTIMQLNLVLTGGHLPVGAEIAL